MEMMRLITVTAVLAGVTWGQLLAPPPAGADSLSIGINIGTPAPPPPPPPVAVAAPPRLVVVPGSPVYYAPSLSVNFFAYEGRYFSYHQGAWFVASGHSGPWTHVATERVPRAVLAVPVAYYKVPPGHAKANGGPPPGHGKGPKHKGKGD